MVIRVGMLGSCESRDLFNSAINTNYKDYFLLEIDTLRTSFISLMQKPQHIDNNLLKIYPETPSSIKASSFLKEDFEKTFFEKLNQTEIDVLIIDNYFEVRFGVGYFDGILLTNNDWDLYKTEFYKNTNHIKTITMLNNTNEFFELWRKYCDLFFEYMNNNFPEIKIILNMARLTGIVEKEDGSKYIDENFTKIANQFNPLINRLDTYIINHYNVDVLDFDFENFNLAENHPWGISPNHYNSNYYSNLTEQIISIKNSYDSLEDRMNFLYDKNKSYINKINELKLK